MRSAGAARGSTERRDGDLLVTVDVESAEYRAISRTWPEDTGVTDVIVGRARLLTTEQSVTLATAATEAKATLWLLGSDSDLLQTPAIHQAQRAMSALAEMIGL
ncbi:hypothetical protein [Nonomuraea sp. NPDC050783]|uniref:hypothetical protein n=1 Tax=Nonomuraea sp. NPDC050783 TaxID=3154634 RepID=UPI00346598F0